MPPKPIPLPVPRRSSSNAASDLNAAAALSGSPRINQIPTYVGSPSRPELVAGFGSPGASGSGSGSNQGLTVPQARGPALSHSSSNESLPSNAVTPMSIEDLTEAQKAAIVRRHLLNLEDQNSVLSELSGTPPQPGSSGSVNAWGGRDDSTVTPTPNDSAIEDGYAYPVPYNMPGGDITAPLYKWAAAQQGEDKNNPGLRRSKSLVSIDRAGTRGRAVSGVDAMGEDSEDEEGMRVREILEPGGFRRDFVVRKMAETGSVPAPGSRFTKSFVDFLSLYGHFSGEDLEEIDETDEDEDEDVEYEGENVIPRYVPQGGDVGHYTSATNGSAASEGSQLVRRPSNKRRGMSRRASSRGVGDHGDATVTQAVLMLLKSFVGTGVLFLGKAFYNGGMIFSTIVLMFIAMISLYSFLLLVRTRLVVHGSFGDIGGILYGKYMRWMILFSIVISQIGFVAAYTIFVAQNLQAFVMAVTNCRTLVAIPLLIFAQLVVFLPLAMIRNIQKLSGTALVADAFILFGLVYIFSNEIKVLADNGLADIKLFNSKDFPLLIGTAVFAFEGIGLVIPITESMKDPHQFPRVLTGVMMGVMVLFAGSGVLAYAAYGSAIQTVVFVNLPQSDRFVNASQFLYSLAILLSTPLQLFPAVRIMENGIFSRSGKFSDKVKWEKNVFRAVVVLGSTMVAWVGANDLDKFVSLIGSVACVPLCFCYPALLHYKACAVTRRQKIADIALFVFGLVAMVYTTSQTIKLLASGAPSGPPVFGNCPN